MEKAFVVSGHSVEGGRLFWVPAERQVATVVKAHGYLVFVAYGMRLKATAWPKKLWRV